MIEVSSAWKDIQPRFLLPETYVEIDCTIAEVGAQEAARIDRNTTTNQATISNASSVLVSTQKNTKYATNELNLWALDGSATIAPGDGSAGYVSNIESTGNVDLSFTAPRTAVSPGLTITWSSMLDEYPSVFEITAKNGNTIVANVTITDNTDRVSTVFLPMQNYNRIEVKVHSWGLPNRRARIENIVIGHVMTLTKSDILSFSHEQSGDLLSGELPRYSIEFTLDNSDGRWNPTNPSGMERYLSERQRLTVRYGLDVNGVIEWIKAGTFYLSEWDAPSNGLEARFVARDVFDFLIGAEVWVEKTGALSELVSHATQDILPDGASVVYDSSLVNYSRAYSPSYTEGAVDTAATIVQKCANAACGILRYDRDGVLYVEKLKTASVDYTIPLSLSYSYPQITLSKPLKEVDVDYGGTEPYKLQNIASDGEVQTLSNEYIENAENAKNVAAWVSRILQNRKTVSGEFRADPRLDLYDIVTVESKYGVLTPVAITNIKYTYNGSFRGSYTGRVLEVMPS